MTSEVGTQSDVRDKGASLNGRSPLLSAMTELCVIDVLGVAAKRYTKKYK